MSLNGLVQRAHEVSERIRTGWQAGIGGGSGDSDVSTHAAADNPLTENTAAESLHAAQDWEWI